MQGLTREEAINEHRKMWNWIVDKLQSKDCKNYLNAYDIKAEYLKERYGDSKYNLYHACFLCDYVSDIPGILPVERCLYCPLDWGENIYDCGIFPDGLYYNFDLFIRNNICREEASDIARQIANLPEKEREWKNEIKS